MEYPGEQRERIWRRIQEERYDLVVVGGGIVGAGILRDAARRGLRAALFEREDIASGTSSRSSKLIHGGLRYLETFQFSLVFESTHERSRLMRLSRNLVHPLPFLLPIHRSSRNGLAKITAGMWLYDILASFSNYKMHRVLGRRSLLAQEPSLRSEGLRGGVQYYDAATDDARLTLETLIDGVEAGGVALNRAEVIGLQVSGGRVRAVGVRDTLTGHEAEVATGCVICALGPWTETVLTKIGVGEHSPRLRPTKGAHIVLRREKLPLRHAVVMTSPVDGRVMFAIPWRGATIIGTTDTDYPTDPESIARVFADRADVEYLLTSVSYYFPEIRVGLDDVTGTWAALRPLIAPKPAISGGRDPHPSQVSREHEIKVDPRGIVTVAGGKLTTYRLMAAETLSFARRFLPEGTCRRTPTDKIPLPYSRTLRDDKSVRDLESEATRRFRVSPEAAHHLVFNYGCNALKILDDYLKEDPHLLEPLVPDLPYLRLEAVYAAHHEMALTVSDFLCRRIPLLFLDINHALGAAQDVALLMGQVLGWDSRRREKEVKDIEALARDHSMFRRSAGASAAPPPG